MSEYNLKQKKRINDFMVDLTALLIKHSAEIDLEEIDTGYYSSEARLYVAIGVNRKGEDYESIVYEYELARGRENINSDDTLRKMIK